MRVPRQAAATLLAACALALATVAGAADYYVVVGDGSPVARLSQTEALHLFMGRSRSFPDGSMAVPYDLSDTAQRAGFYRALSGMSLPQVTSYWARLMFSGRKLPPQEIGSEAEMVEKLQRDPAAIGWLPQEPRRKGLRTVLILKDNP